MKHYSAIALGLVAVSLTACGKEKEAPKLTAGSEAVPVVVQTLAEQPFEDWQEFTAELKGSQDVQIVTRVGGKLQKLAKVGQRVGAGQSLCSIESDRYGAFVTQAQAALDLALSEQARLKANVDAGSIGADVLLKARLDVETARVNLLNARTNQQDNLCPAPFAGVVVSRSVEDNQFVAPGSPMLRLANNSRFEAVVSIPENQAIGLRPGQKAEFFSASDTSIRIPATLKDMDLSSDAKSRNFKARLLVPNRSNELQVGMVGRVRILLNRYPSALLVPSSSLLRLQTGIFAMVVGKDGKAEQRQVEIAETAKETVRVLRGLQAGDKLVTSGAFRLTQGTPLKVQEK